MIKIEEVAALGWVEYNNPDRYYFLIERPHRDENGEIVTDWSAYKRMYVLYTPWHKKTDSCEGWFEGTEFRIKEWVERERSENEPKPFPVYLFKGHLDSIAELEVLMKQVRI